ncbi:Spy/CpxP family protein refolding chaperone [Kerstersia sp.]|uniref:Spy/CpxP family protein refolding chaperone n=1 Tax=Kerstersia sp. TaxID=1930783 RepID=UPI003F8F78A1
MSGFSTPFLSRSLVAGALLAALSAPVLAQPADTSNSPSAAPLQERSYGPHPDMMMRHGDMNGTSAGPGWGHHFERLDLSEAQRDQLFNIRHQAEPALHESRKALRQASRELRDLGRAKKLDTDALKRASDALGNAVAEEARLRVQRDNALYHVLTPEQRAQLAERRQENRRGMHQPGARGSVQQR